jgi:hypothetical protein
VPILAPRSKEENVELLDKLIIRAASWLDAQYPGWAEKIDLANFHMGDASRCVGWYVLGTREGWTGLGGQFDAVLTAEEKDSYPGDSIFAERTDLWTALIEARGGGAKASLAEKLTRGGEIPLEGIFSGSGVMSLDASEEASYHAFVVVEDGELIFFDRNTMGSRDVEYTVNVEALRALLDAAEDAIADQ